LFQGGCVSRVGQGNPLAIGPVPHWNRNIVKDGMTIDDFAIQVLYPREQVTNRRFIFTDILGPYQIELTAGLFARSPSSGQVDHSIFLGLYLQIERLTGLA